MILVFAVGITYGQERLQLKGPKAKNFKHWKAEKPSTAVVTSLNVERVHGAKTKNAGIWRYDRRARGTSKLATTNRARLKAAKIVPFTGWIRSSAKYSIFAL